MQRREALRLLAATAALPILSRDAFSLFREVHEQLAKAPALKTLNPHQNATVTAMSELIIPQTDTPGAKAVRVNEFIDLILTEWYEGDERARFLAGLNDVDLRSRDVFGKSFIDCSEKELSEKGLETLVLEAGRAINPDTDYVEHVPIWEKRFRGLGDRKRFNDDQPIQQTCSGVDEWNCKFFVNDRENPYTTDPDKPFLWIRGRHVGGRSIMWGRQSYRWSDLDFEANLREGIAIDWPIRYQDIAPWYDYVEDFIGVT